MPDKIIIDENSPLFKTEGMFSKIFPSDLRQVRFFGLLVVQKAPPAIREINLLEQQITELLKNAIKHGNKNNPKKKVHSWFFFNAEKAHVIIEDEGAGFQDLEKWNEFNRKRNLCLESGDYEGLMQYASYQKIDSNSQDGGNALFAAVEYWNGGFVFNKKKNKVAAYKKFATRAIGRMTEKQSEISAPL